MKNMGLARYLAFFAACHILAIVVIGALAAAFPTVMGQPKIGPLLVVRVLTAQATYYYFAHQTGRLLNAREYWILTLGSYAVCLILEVGVYFIQYLNGVYTGEDPNFVVAIMTFALLFELAAIALGYSPFIGRRVLAMVERTKNKASP